MDDIWTILSAVERGRGEARREGPHGREDLDMPRMSDVVSGAETTWGEQYDKGSLRGIPFWIHNMRASTYEDKMRDESDPQRVVNILVVDITLNGPSRHDPHAVIVLGNTPEREPMLAYFNSPTGSREPIGPVHCFEVPLKAGRSFWRLEDWDEEILTGAALAESVDANGQRALPSGK
jgi:hypothetical protein